MAKAGAKIKQQLSIDVLMEKYDEWLRRPGNLKRKNNSEITDITDDVVKSYKTFDLFFKRDSFGGKQLTNQEKHFIELLPKLIGIKNKTYKGTYKDRKVNVFENQLKGTDIISKIIEGIENYLFKNNELTKTEKNQRTYVRRFFDFISQIDKHVESTGWNYPSLSAGDLAILSGEEGEIYLHNVLRTKFKSRLRCQDRTSGDKIWLPLRFIGKIYSENKKTSKVNKKGNAFTEWLDSLVNDIYIYYEENVEGLGKVVRSVKFDALKNVLLKLEQSKDDNKKFAVKIRFFSEGQNFKEFQVLTPTGKGNKKVPMIVNSISDIAIDHVKSIDSTLRDLSNQNKLQTLLKVSNKYKEIQMEDEPNEDEAVKDLLGVGGKSKKISLRNLKNELDEIKNDGILRLMSSEYNSQKSNGDTFQRIINQGDEYWGILEEKEEITDDNGERVYYYQKLTNQLDSKNSFKVTRTKPDGDVIQLNEVDINII